MKYAGWIVAAMIVTLALAGDPTCPSDVDGDNNVGTTDLIQVHGSGEVGMVDLLLLLGSWGPVAPSHPADLDGDGNVGTNDLLILLSRWGPCPRTTTGACCLGDGSCLDATQEDECESLDGAFQGAGTTCVSNPCPQPAACCFGNSCQLLVPADCAFAGGVFIANAGCGGIGACCFGFECGLCNDGVAVCECVSQAGNYQGDGSNCN